MQFSPKQLDAILAGLLLLRKSLEDGSVRPDDDELGSVLANGGAHPGMAAADLGEFCERLNCGDFNEAITLDLNVFDDDGNVVDGTTAELTQPQASDIVDHASQAILLRREGKDYAAVLDELESALVAADVIRAT